VNRVKEPNCPVLPLNPYPRLDIFVKDGAKSAKKALLLAAYNWTKDKVEGGVVLRGLMQP